MQIIVNSDDSPAHIRLAASFLLHLAGDLPEAIANLGPDDGRKPFTTPPAPPAPPAPVAAAATVAATSGAASAELPPPPPPPSNVVNFPTPPAASDAPTAASVSTAASAPAPTATTASAASGSDSYDTSGLPWDGRIHQAKKGVKKDGTWKLQKGIDMTLVAAVVAELSTKRLPAAVTTTAPASQMDAFTAPPPPPAPPVSLPAANTGPTAMPLPPLGAALDLPVNAGTAAPSLPAPPAPPVGPVPTASTGFRELIQKISAGTKDKKLTPAVVAQIVQARGCPALQNLRDMAHLIPDVEADIDAVLLS